MKNIFIICSAALALLLTACGGGGGSGDTIPEMSSNPVTQTQLFGENGNIWKPAADPHASGAGNLVVLLSASFTQQFERCELNRADGTIEQLYCQNTVEWTQTPFSCFSNGNRQTWRSLFKCSQAGEVKVTCFEANQEVVFTVPEAARGAVCSRFG